MCTWKTGRPIRTRALGGKREGTNNTRDRFWSCSHSDGEFGHLCTAPSHQSSQRVHAQAKALGHARLAFRKKQKLGGQTRNGNRSEQHTCNSKHVLQRTADLDAQHIVRGVDAERRGSEQQLHRLCWTASRREAHESRDKGRVHSSHSGWGRSIETNRGWQNQPPPRRQWWVRPA